jgi:hypothetical protein
LRVRLVATVVGWVLATGLLMAFVQEGGAVPPSWRARGHLAAALAVPAAAGLCHRSWRVAALVLGLEVGVALAVLAWWLWTFDLSGPFFPD